MIDLRKLLTNGDIKQVEKINYGSYTTVITRIYHKDGTANTYVSKILNPPPKLKGFFN